LAAATDRPSSETEGLSELDIVGTSWTNIPPPPIDYVARPVVEKEILSALANDRHPIITLVGRGGIGKTSLALNVLQAIARTGRFEAIIWFSARDIDLLPTGPKIVKPHILTEQDVSDEFVNLMKPTESKAKGFRSTSYFAEFLSKSKIGGPALFVLDNFETVRSPIDLFNWIDTNVRLPNKILITTRFRDFKADFPIEVHGMERDEAEQLIDTTARSLGIARVITEKYRDGIYEESDGHPYIIKILVGEIVDSKQLGEPRRVIARKEEILDALFERTYSNLTPVARRVFLTLCAWRSLVPQLALEAVLLRPENERMDVSQAVDELVRMSLVQRTASAADGTDFLDVPLAAAIFGQRKLGVSPDKASVEADVRMLQDIGPTSATTLKEGLRPRVTNLFQRIAERVANGKGTLAEMLPVLEIVARGYPMG
jgi:hypothetical protein